MGDIRQYKKVERVMFHKGTREREREREREGGEKERMLVCYSRRREERIIFKC